MDRLQVWEPQVLVTLDRAPVYDLETDTIPGLTVTILPGGELNGGCDGAEGILLHDLLGEMPNQHEQHRWQFAIHEALSRQSASH